MPMTPDLRRKVDQIRDDLFGGGYPDPVSNAEQLAFLFFFYLIESLDAQNAARARVMKQPWESLFAGTWTLRNPLNATKKGEMEIPAERLRWSSWARSLSADNLVRFVRDEVFPFYADMATRSAVNFMDGARLGIDEPAVLTKLVSDVDALRLDQADADTKGDLFEHVLRQIKQAGELGQFRTPRHVIRAIVDIIDPKIGETVYDPAAGTAGFLVAAYNHIRLAHSSPAGTHVEEVDGKPQTRGLGDKLTQKRQSQLANRTFYGNDVDPKMVRLATMNLTLRGLPNVRILRRNVLTSTLDAQQRADLHLPDAYDVVLANPPFSGRIDKDRIVEDVRVGTSTATEILFLKYMLDSLKPDGRCGVIVPEGVLFGSTGAHKTLRRMLVEHNTVEAVLSLPAGVFQPYSGVKTSVLFFRKGTQNSVRPERSATESRGVEGRGIQRVLFLNAENDGYKLDANHDQPIDADDLPGLIEVFKTRDARWKEWTRHSGEGRNPDAVRPERSAAGAESKGKTAGSNPAPATSGAWTHNWWFATAEQLRANDYNLSASRYRPVNAQAVEYRDPRELLDELAGIEAEIASEVEALRLALAEGVP
ncbi:MAG TPA: class I SAM-dependent DNA methyltransferase [Rhodanobacteraceae bacterium]|nr:class I SAM-dependent DNA methyltransferase [Rhodanobacteraceae bacterium]